MVIETTFRAISQKWQSGVLLTVCCLTDMLFAACPSTMGVLALELSRRYEGHGFLLSFTMSASNGLAHIMCLPLGLVIDKIGNGNLLCLGSIAVTVGCILTAHITNLYAFLISYGLLAGIGFGCFSLAGVATVNKQFDKHRASAIGFVKFGFGLASFMWPIITNLLLNTYGISGTFMLLGGILLNGLVLGSFLRVLLSQGRRKIESGEVQKNTEEDVEKKSVFLKLFQDKCRLLFYAIGICLGNFGPMVDFLFLPEIVYVSGHSTQEAAFILSILGISNCLARFSTGLLVEIPIIKRNREFVLPVTFLTSGTLKILIRFCSSYLTFTVYSILQGVTFGTYVCSSLVVAVDIVGRQNASFGTGTVLCSVGIALLSSGTLAGWLRNQTDLVTTFMVIGLVQMLGCLTCFFNGIRKTSSTAEDVEKA